MALHACIHFVVDQEEYEGTCKTSSFISDVMMVRIREAARVEALFHLPEFCKKLSLKKYFPS